jgi:hypothetical protein
VALNKVNSADAVWMRSIVGRMSGMLLGFGLAALLTTAQAQTRSAFLVGNNAYTPVAALQRGH